MKTLYVTDLDGTLLNSESEISPYSSQLISALSQDRALISIATARTPATVEHILRGTYVPIPVIVMTGAAMWDNTAKRYIEPHFLAADTCRDVKRLIQAHGVNPFTYTLGADGCLEVFHTYDLTPVEHKFVDERRHLRLKHFHFDDPREQEPSVPDTILYFAIGDNNAIVEIAERLRATVDCSVGNYLDVADPGIGLLDIYAPRISKAHAVKELARRCGAGRIVVFGDNLNDIPMMEVADVAVAVDNALPEVKAIADVVIGSNCDDSVARYIEKDFRGRQ